MQMYSILTMFKDFKDMSNHLLTSIFLLCWLAAGRK